MLTFPTPWHGPFLNVLWLCGLPIIEEEANYNTCHINKIQYIFILNTFPWESVWFFFFLNWLNR